MATLSVDGIAIAEINTGSAEQLKRLASDGLGASWSIPDDTARMSGSATAYRSPKVTCTITLEFPDHAHAR